MTQSIISDSRALIPRRFLTLLELKVHASSRSDGTAYCTDDCLAALARACFGDETEEALVIGREDGLGIGD